MLTYLFGPHAVEDALRAKRPMDVIYVADSRRKKDIENILHLAKESGIKVQFVPLIFFKKLSSEQNIPHQGVAAKSAEIKIQEFKDWIAAVDIGSNPVVVLVDHLEDPHNFGAIIRSAAAFGVEGLLFPKHRNATFGPAAERAAAGGQNHVPLVRVSNVAETVVRLQEHGFWVIGTDSVGDEELQKVELNKPVVLVFGGEHQGLHRLVRERCDQIVKVPISNKVESLNVGVAAGIFLWEFFKKRF